MSSVEFPHIERLIPHRLPMRLIERVIAIEAETIIAEAVVPNDPLFFVQEERPPGYLVIEMMAQTIAAWDGWQRYQDRCEPTVGFLLGTRRFHCRRSLLEPGMRLQICGTTAVYGGEMASFKCKAFEDKAGAGSALEEFAGAVLSVFRPGIVEAS